MTNFLKFFTKLFFTFQFFHFCFVFVFIHKRRYFAKLNLATYLWVLCKCRWFSQWLNRSQKFKNFSQEDRSIIFISPFLGWENTMYHSNTRLIFVHFNSTYPLLSDLVWDLVMLWTTSNSIFFFVCISISILKMIPLKCQKYCIYTRKRHSQKEALKTVYHVDLVQINVCKVPLYTSFFLTVPFAF